MVIVQEHLKITLATALAFAIGVLSAHSSSILSLVVQSASGAFVVYFIPKGLTLLGFTNPFLKNDWEAFALTLTTYCFGVIDYLCLQHLDNFSAYLIITTIYHYGEFQLVNSYHNHQLCWHSFLIYHSRPYTIANISALAEHLIWTYVVGVSWKTNHIFLIPSFLVMLSGLVIRLLSFYTAKSNFTHLVQHEKAEKHQLVTHGIYSLMRHPGYMGFFYYSLASMVFIGNPFCFVAYAVVLSRFFRNRILVEQYYLQEFFPEYEAYRKRTPTLIPFAG